LEKIESHTVGQLDKKIRLSDYGGKAFSLLPTRKGVKKAITKGLVFVNGERGKTGDWLKGGEILELFKSNFKQPNRKLLIKIPIVFEDEHLAVVIKPPGIPVSGNQHRTLENGLQGLLKLSPQPDSIKLPKPVHRLDHPTSGLIIVAKTKSAVRSFTELFAERKIDKTYLAVCIGEVKAQKVSSSIRGKKADTQFIPLSNIPSPSFGTLSLVQLKPITGRRHQLRIHLHENGTPILGDKQYFIDGKILKGKGLYLFANKLQFDHPFTKKPLVFEAETPTKFLKLFPSDKQ